MAGQAWATLLLLNCFLFCSIFAIVRSQVTEAADASEKYISDEQKLLDHLMKERKYNKHLRPTNGTDRVQVNFGLALLEIIRLDDTRDYLDIVIWMRQLWTDFRLEWDPSKFDGLSSIRIPSDQVWRPDIVSYNHPKNDWYFNNNVVVYSDGNVLFIPPGETRMKCNVDPTYFPGDSQQCTAKFGSWTFDGYQVSLDFYDGLEEIDLSDYTSSKQYHIVKNTAHINHKYYPCCAEPYPDATFTLEIRRKTSAMWFSLLLTPGLLIALLSPLLFVLPSGAPHRFNMGGALLVCLTLMMLIMGRDIPPHPSPPLIARYFAGLFVMVSVSLGLSALTANLAHRTTRQRSMPAVLQSLMNCLARPLCVNTDRDYSHMDDRRPSDPPSGDKDVMMTSGHVRQDWRIMAAVLDRLFFIIFLIVSIIFSLAILPQIVNFDSSSSYLA